MLGFFINKLDKVIQGQRNERPHRLRPHWKGARRIEISMEELAKAAPRMVVF